MLLHVRGIIDLRRLMIYSNNTTVLCFCSPVLCLCCCCDVIMLTKMPPFPRYDSCFLFISVGTGRHAC